MKLISTNISELNLTIGQLEQDGFFSEGHFARTPLGLEAAESDVFGANPGEIFGSGRRSDVVFQSSDHFGFGVLDVIAG